MKRAAVSRIAAVLLPLALASLPIVACSKESSLTEKGGSCLLATDCAPGLICVPQRRDGAGPRVCTDDLTNVAGGPPANDAGAADANNADAPQRQDTGTPDTGTPDTGTPDTGSPVQDAADDG